MKKLCLEISLAVLCASLLSACDSTLTDPRDGQTYRTVTIGTQTWMAQNINYKTENSYCYDDEARNCTKYGRLYTWDAATTVCPTGWRLPSKAEWEALIEAVGGQSTAGKMLKSQTDWNDNGSGTDAFAFSALPAGNSGSGYYLNEGDIAFFWSSTESSSDGAYYMNLLYSHGNAGLVNDDKYYGFSVRCLKD